MDKFTKLWLQSVKETFDKGSERDKNRAGEFLNDKLPLQALLLFTTAELSIVNTKAVFPT